MSEEEIIQGIDDMRHLELNPEYKVKIINGILDLYNKEKEKNEELQNYIKEYLIPKSTINLLYISKEKIRELKQKIDKEHDKAIIEFMRKKDNFVADGDIAQTLGWVSGILKELLEEE